MYSKDIYYEINNLNTSSMVGVQFFLKYIGLPTTTTTGRLKGIGDLHIEFI